MTTSTSAPVRRWQKPSSVELLAVGTIAFILLRPLLDPLVNGAAAQAWLTVFVSIVLQALPFLVLGVAISGSVAAFLPPERLVSVLPRPAALSVPVAGVAGMLLPGCECGSVPIAGGLVARGIPASAALTFLLSAPAINPVVLVSTAVAFTGQPEYVVARFVASLLTAVVVGWMWAAVGRPAWLRRPVLPDVTGMSRREVLVSTARHDLLHAGGFLVIGGIAAATLAVAVPRDLITALGGAPLLSVLLLAVLAIVMSICSEADAFVAASLTDVSPTAKLAFLVVGPMVDLKLLALQAGTFGRGFPARFAPLTLAVALAVSAVVGGLVL